MPWGEFADKIWLPSRAVADSTARGDQGRIERRLRPKWGAVPLREIKRTAVKAWAGELAREVGPDTVRLCTALLSTSLTAAVDDGLIAANPAARLRLPKPPADRERFLTRAEAAALRDGLKDQNDLLIFDLLLGTGMRWSEVAGLHWPRVDLARRQIRVVETFDQVAGVMNPHPKSRRPRSVPIPPALAERLAALKPTAGSCGVKHTQGRCPGPLVAASPSGKPLAGQNWRRRRFAVAVDAAGLEGVRIHDLRHTYASWLLQAGVPLAEVGGLLGHSSPATTQRYARLAREVSPAVMAALEDF